MRQVYLRFLMILYIFFKDSDPRILGLGIRNPRSAGSALKSCGSPSLIISLSHSFFLFLLLYISILLFLSFFLSLLLYISILLFLSFSLSLSYSIPISILHFIYFFFSLSLFYSFYLSFSLFYSFYLSSFLYFYIVFIKL
jgi:hypothetical protein